MEKTVKYIEVRFNRKTGKITTHNSTENAYNLYDRSIFTRCNTKTGLEYEFFVTSNKNMKKDFNKHFGSMLKELDKEQKRINKSYAEIRKMIFNSQEL